MRGLTFLLIISIIFGGAYWYNVAKAVCDVPISYRLGNIDPRFTISEDEVRNALFGAESIWEDATGANLFTLEDDANLTINFVYDERQEQANEEEELREVLERKGNMSDSIRAQYEELLSKYTNIKRAYEKDVASYESKLDRHNAEVAEWNAKGGAPADVYERLEATQKQLAREQRRLNGIADSLNTLARQMNTLSARGNSLISDYNEIAEEYNTKFTESHEFTQGDYGQEEINIYQYDSREELELVLAHEFGHALSLGHVEGKDSIMHFLMGGQSLEKGLTTADLDEFKRVCGDGSISYRMMHAIRERLFSESLK